MINLCTYFDRAYLAKGIALIESIRRHVADYQVFILALDPATVDALARLYLHDRQIVIIPLPVLESADLLAADLQAARAQRTPREYIWTLTAPWIEYLLVDRGLPDLAYIDSDCYFFTDPAPMYAEVAGHSIGIIPHRWTPRHAARLRPNGIYNVGWVYFRDDEAGRDCLRRWALNCLAWQGPAGAFSDQPFLDDWPALYPDRLRVIAHIGANVAPWNQERYDFMGRDGAPLIVDISAQATDDFGILSAPAWPVLFYHFHELRLGDRGQIAYRTGYPLSPNVGRLIYDPYERMLVNATSRA